MIDLRQMFSDEEVIEFFNKNGINTGYRKSGYWRKTTHGDDKWIEYDDLVVIIDDNQQLNARKVFEEYASSRMKELIVSTGCLRTQINLLKIISNDGLQQNQPAEKNC